MGFLFGEEAEAPTTQFTTKPLLTTPQEGLLNQLIGQVAGQMGQGVGSYPGTYTPGPSGNQSDIFNMISQLLGYKAPLQGQGMGTLSQLMKPFDPSLAMDYWQKSVKAPMMETWQNETVPNIMEQFAAYDAAGSGGAKSAVAESGRRLNTDIGSILAQTLLNQENMVSNRNLNAAEFGLGYGTDLVNKMIPGAAMERGITSEQMQEPYQKWLYSQPYNNPWLNYINPALGTRAFENIGYQTGGSGGSQGIFGDLLKAGSQLGSAAMMSGMFL